MSQQSSVFRTVECASWSPESLEGLHWITVKSPSLRARADLSVYVPPTLRAGQKAPLVILLHGVYGSHWAWTAKGRAPQSLQHLICTDQIPPLVLAMPSDGLWGDGSGYVSHPHADFEKWIIRDVPQVVTEVTRAIDPEARVALSGLSMGGFGALYLGAKYAERVFSISAHSSLTAFAQMTRFVEEPLTNYGIDPAAHTVIDWMRRHDQHLPPIRFDCGHDDPLIEENRLLHAQLTAAQIPHTYEEYPGGHSWDYWQTHLSRSLLHISHSFPR